MGTYICGCADINSTKSRRKGNVQTSENDKEFWCPKQGASSNKVTARD